MALKDLKQKIVDEFPISELIGHYLPLTRRGTSTLAVCPFHNDSHPSLNISDSRKYYKCFACGAGGNAIDFVVNYKNLSFVEALKEISEFLGLSFDDFSEESKRSPKEEMALKILNASAKIYQKYAQNPQFSEFQEFLVKRKIDPEIQEKYQLGIAPGQSGVFHYLSSLPKEKDRELALKVAEEIGLIRPNQRSGESHYDTFRDRIIFPIWDQFGQVIGFTGRATKDYQKAKYMNSKDSFVFNKRNLLYGLHLAKSHIRKEDQVILCEGNMDQLALYKKGFQYSVAIMGIALGDYSLKILASLSKNIFLALDNDNAGHKAAERINIQFLSHGIIPKFVDLTPHKDPDEFLAEMGSVEMQKRLDQARPFVDVQFQELLTLDHSLLDQKLSLLKKSFQLVAPLGKNIQATERVGLWAKKLGLQSSPEQIIEQYFSSLSQNRPLVASLPDEEPNAPESVPSPIEEKELAITRQERRLVRELVQHPECLTGQKLGELLDFVHTPEVKDYVLRLRETIFEIDEEEYVPIVKTLLNQDVHAPGLRDAVLEGLGVYRKIKLSDEKRDRLLVDIEKRLVKERLREKREELKRKKETIRNLQDLNELLLELQGVEKKLFDLNRNPQKGVT